MKIMCNEMIAAYDLPTNIDGFIAKIEEKIKTTGAPRNKVSISIECSEAYGDYRPYIDLCYTREETEDERKLREEAKYKLEAAEKKTYERLKAKFG